MRTYKGTLTVIIFLGFDEIEKTGGISVANIPYAVIGGNAVQHWVSQVDESVVRNTQGVDIILIESDLEEAIPVLESAGFIYR